jgi:hypothetical protein
VLSSSLLSLARAQERREIVVNGERLRPETIQALEQQYRVPLQSGRYWYDRVSGLWGYEGGPAIGQVQPGLSLGGTLRANASGGGTHVFVNGRALHPADIAYLQRCMPIVPGRYWMNAAGIGGIEGGPPQFNIIALCQQAYGGGPRGVQSCFGSITQGGGITGYAPPAGVPGGSGMTCGPDWRLYAISSRWREMRACNDNVCGESKSQNSPDSLLDLTSLIAATDPKVPIYCHLISRQRLFSSTTLLSWIRGCQARSQLVLFALNTCSNATTR